MADSLDLQRELDETRALVAQQALQIRRLEEAASQASGLNALRELLEMSDIVGVTVGQAPYRSLLQGIVNAAARIFDAGGASIALIDHDAEELVFEAASGESDIVGMRFPATHGIAGYVVMTGESIASADVSRDPRFARDVAESTGYMPTSIMAVPLIVREDVEGVLEVLDKANADSFGLDDMELLTLFARPAAIAVEQARMVTNMGTMLVGELERLAREQGNEELATAAHRAASDGRATQLQTVEIARLVHRLSRRGDRARQLALDILTSITRYAGA